MCGCVLRRPRVVRGGRCIRGVSPVRGGGGLGWGGEMGRGGGGRGVWVWRRGGGGEGGLGSVTVASLYLPSGEVGTERQQEKERFMKSFLPYLVERRAQVEAQGRDLVVCGDWNIAHTEADLKNWRNNRKNSGF